MRVSLPTYGLAGTKKRFKPHLKYRPLAIKYIGNTETNKPVKCIISSEEIPFHLLRPDGKDIVFLDKYGNVLPYWIENKNNTLMQVWLKFPKASKSFLPVYMYYNNLRDVRISHISAAFKYRRKITITELSGNNLSDYQVRIDLDSTNFDFSHFLNGGKDLRFTDASGDLLSYWVEKMDITAQEATIWVKVPSIPANSSVEIYMYYGNPKAGSGSDGKEIFMMFYSFEDGHPIGWTCVSDFNNQAVKIGDRILIGYHSPDKGDNGILIYDINEKNWSRKAIFTDNEKGDHYPAVLLETTNYILVFIPHRPGTVATLHVYRYDYNLNFMDSVQLTDYHIAFPQVVKLSNGRIYCFWRDDTDPDAPIWKYRYSDDEGATWSNETQLTTAPGYGKLNFLHVDTDGEKIYAVYNEWGGGRTWGIWFMYLDTDGQWKKDDGTVITLPASPDDMSRPSLSEYANPWQILYYNGKVYIFFHDETDSANYKYYRAIWDGSSWSSEYICDSNHDGISSEQPRYGLGICAKQDNPDIVYVSVDVDGIAEIQKWKFNGGWTKVEDITENSTKDNWRPVAVRNGTEDFDVVWQIIVGYYTGPADASGIYLGARNIYPPSITEWTLSSGIVFENNVLKISAATDQANYLNSAYTNTTLNPQGTALEIKTKISGATSNDFWNVGWRQDADTVYVSWHSYSTTRDWDLTIKGVDAGTVYGEASGYNDVYAQDEWHRFSLRVRENTLKLVDVNNSANELSSTDAFFGQITSANIGFGRWANYGAFYVDYIFVRKYTEPEPSVSLGAEETA